MKNVDDRDIKILEEVMDWICLNQPMTSDDGVARCRLYDKTNKKCIGIPSACIFAQAREIVQKLKTKI